MADEELIYRITRAVYDRVGNAIDEQTVEQLVTDISGRFRLHLRLHPNVPLLPLPR